MPKSQAEVPPQNFENKRLQHVTLGIFLEMFPFQIEKDKNARNIKGLQRLFSFLSFSAGVIENLHPL